ncbi:hypothetical protein NSU18_25495 [Paenibacillus sp. FSL H8-0048]|uniref:hypothetical protein n=1 Tax=Paenibacillus sp. FSL H8-0048 TaxID=2954508 RepID=UPI0030FA3121
MRWFGKPGSGPGDGDTRNYLSLRINLFFFGTFFIFVIIMIRLAGLQFVESPELSEVEASRETKDVPLAAIRGTIHAAGGEDIAHSTPIQSLFVTLTQEYTAKVKNKKTGLYEPTAEAKANTKALVAGLSSVFEEYGDPAAKKLLKEDILLLLDLEYKKSLGYVPRKIKTGLTMKEVAHLMENRQRYPGVSVVEESIRHYDKDTVAVQTVGYMKQFRSTEKGYNLYKNIRSAMWWQWQVCRTTIRMSGMPRSWCPKCGTKLRIITRTGQLTIFPPVSPATG